MRVFGTRLSRSAQWNLNVGDFAVYQALESYPFQSACQSSGGNSTPQKPGLGERNSIPTRMRLSEESPKVTTRHACSSLVARLVRTISARIFTGWCRKNRPPCAFITIVSVSSLKFLPSAFLLEARTGMLIQSRRLRRSVLICTFDMIQAIVQAGQS